MISVRPRSGGVRAPDLRVRHLGLSLLLVACSWAQGQTPAAPATEQRIDALLSQMSLQEKLGQLTQFDEDQKDLESLIRQGKVGSVLNATGAAVTNHLQKIAVQQSRLKIPLLFGFDAIHGYRTIFPIPLAIASTWDPEMAELTARVTARETRAAGVHWTFAPMVDITRDPRWGRMAEGAGEDPYLGSAMAAAYVKGFQGADLTSPQSVLACAKHYVAYGAAEAGRDYNSVDMSEERLREVYLPPFKAAIDAGVGTLMSAFNALNYVPASANRWTLTDILRKEWRFDGFVVSDWTSVGELVPHGIAATPEQAAGKALAAGVDMDMASGSYLALADGAQRGEVSMATIDEAVRRVLRVKFRLGLFDHPFADEQREPATMLTADNVAAAREVARRSIVLLKNEGRLLPIAETVRSIAVIGPLADDKQDMLGCWSGKGDPKDAVSLLQAVRARLKGRNVAYAKGTEVLGDSPAGFDEAVRLARNSDLVIMALGEKADMSGEAASRAFLDLPGNQQQLLEAVAKAGKPVVLVLFNGRPLVLPWAVQNISTIVEAWALGTAGGDALADVLFGDVNPSGRLPVSIPRAMGQIPVYYAHLNTGRPISNGEPKYASKFIDIGNDPQFPFGFGLSYTTFAYRDLSPSAGKLSAGGRLMISVEVQNTGSRAGDEVVQLYVGQPVASVSRPVKELKGFQRVHLAAGETKRVEFTLTSDMLSFWHARNGWQAEPGKFDVWVGPNSSEGLHATFVLMPGVE